MAEKQTITKNDVGTIEDVLGDSITKSPENVKERKITSKFVSDGVYKYVYVDTGEDYTP